jgi:hypothetical protein
MKASAPTFRATPAGRSKGLRYWAWSISLFILATGANQLFEVAPQLEGLRVWAYTQEIRWTRLGPAYPRKTFVVEIADNDFWNGEFEAREPLRADRLAEIVDRLVQVHTHVIVLDVDLVSPLGQEGGDLPVYASEDSVLAKSIAGACRNGSVIVIGKPGIQEENLFKALPSRIDLPADKYPCVRWGTMYPRQISV